MQSQGSIFQTPDAVANEFLDLAWDQGKALTPMKLLKLVYFAQGWCLGIADRPLFDEDVQAWQYGPVVYSLYREFKEFGAEPIPRKARQMIWNSRGGLDMIEPDIEMEAQPEYKAFAKAFLAKIWGIYGGYSGIQLSNLTHEPGSPWDQVARRFNYQIPNGLQIPKDLMADYFRRQATREAA